MATGITYSVGLTGGDSVAKAVEKLKKQALDNDDALRIGRMQIQLDKERVAGNDVLAQKLTARIALEKELIEIRGRGGLKSQSDVFENQAREKAAQKEIEIDRNAAAAADAAAQKRRALRAADADAVRSEVEQKQAAAQKLAQIEADTLAKGTAGNANALKLTALQTQADRARVQGKALEAQKLEHQITLERELIRIQALGGTQQQRDQLAAHARAQMVLADKQAEINQAQKLANIQRGNMPGQVMSDGAKRFRMQNVSAQLQDVAVQAQMGTAWTTIAAQQGPQIISALGGTGAMAGAAAGAAIGVAVGTALYGMGQEATKQFDSIIEGAKNMKLEVAKIAATATSQTDVTGGIGKNDDLLKNIDIAQKSSQTIFGSIAARISSWQTGIGVQESLNKLELERSQIQRNAAELQNASISLSESQIKQSEFLISGDDEKVKSLKKQRDLEIEIYNIRNSGLSIDAKEKAVSAAIGADRAREIRTEIDRQKAVSESAENMRANMSIDQKRLSGNDSEADEMERQLKFAREIQAISERKDMLPHEKATAINLIAEKEEIARKMRLRDTEKDAKDRLQKMLDEIDADEKKIAARRRRAREAAEKRKQDEEKKSAEEKQKIHEQAENQIEKLTNEKREKAKAKLSLDQRAALSGKELEDAKLIRKMFPEGSSKRAQADANLLEKDKENEANRDEIKARIMGGNEGAERSAERREDRARKRAERILLNREKNKKRAEMQRDRRPEKEINEVIGAMGGVKPDAIKDHQGDIKKATETSAEKLTKILEKLTVA